MKWNNFLKNGLNWITVAHGSTKWKKIQYKHSTKLYNLGFQEKTKVKKTNKMKHANA
jgi:hypothetical protein